MRKLAGSFFNRHAVEVQAPLRLIVDVWFQNYFTALTGLLFTFPSRYWFTIDLRRYLALPVSSGGFIQAIHVSDYSRSTARKRDSFRIRGHYPLGPRFPARSPMIHVYHFPSINGMPSPYNPDLSCEISVWASPFSLAATQGIPESRSLSRRVSVQRARCLLVSVPPGTEMFHFPGCAFPPHGGNIPIARDGFPHSDISGSRLARQLPGTFRRQAASFIALRSLGIHHTPFRLPRGSLKTT